MPNDVIERCARALCVAVGDDPTREGDLRLTAYDEPVRAVLRALREPSEGMIEASVRAIKADVLGSMADDAKTGWRAAIDHILGADHAQQ